MPALSAQVFFVWQPVSRTRFGPKPHTTPKTYKAPRANGAGWVVLFIVNRSGWDLNPRLTHCIGLLYLTELPLLALSVPVPFGQISGLIRSRCPLVCVPWADFPWADFVPRSVHTHAALIPTKPQMSARPRMPRCSVLYITSYSRCECITNLISFCRDSWVSVDQE